MPHDTPPPSDDAPTPRPTDPRPADPPQPAPTPGQHPSRSTRPEHRWPPALGLAAIVVIHFLLPDRVSGTMRWIIVGVSVLAIVPLLALNPFRMTRDTRWSRPIAITLGVVIVAANQVTMTSMIVTLVQPGGINSIELLTTALGVWVTNVLAFAMLYWELDRGGPTARHMRARDELPLMDLRFPADEELNSGRSEAKRAHVPIDWTPRYTDYLYTSLSNAMAYSATDAMPLSRRFKGLFALQALGCFLLLALVIARAVNILGS